MDKGVIISTLTYLIETCEDGEKTFLDCARDVHDEHIKSLFEERSRGCGAAARELRDLVRDYGGDPKAPHDPRRAVHQAWADLKNAIADHDLGAALSACERGEDAAVRDYRNALDKVLPPEVRTVIERQYQGALRNHDEVKTLRNQYQGSRNLDKR